MSSFNKICKLGMQAALFALLFLVVQIPTLSELAWPNEGNKINIMGHAILLLVSFAIIFPLVTWFSRFVNNKLNFFMPISIKGLSIASLAAVLSQLIQSLISHFVASDNEDIITAFHSPLRLILMITLFLVSPILEEILFQGALQGGILRRLPPIASIMLTALIFSFAHGYGFSMQTVELLVSGLGYAIVYQQTNDIKMAILSHGLANIIVMLVILF